ncbi:MAG: hypothetical protein MJY45_00620 [Bacteroidales bacterium]|nr:hypothetical protein [Bacteroidales bacterium]
MKRRTFKILIFGLTALLSVLTAIIYLSSRKASKSAICTELRVSFDEDYNFVTEADVKEWIEKEYGHYIGQRLDSMDLFSIENMIDRQVAVKKSEVYVTPDGALNVSIAQMEPAIRLEGESFSFYADESGCLFPLQKDCEFSVPVIRGAIPVNYRKGYKGFPENDREMRWVKDLIVMSSFISSDKRWKELGKDIRVEGNGDVVIKFKDVEEKVILGYPENVISKMKRLAVYMDVIKPAKAGDGGRYGTVNLKYKGQIVCRK